MEYNRFTAEQVQEGQDAERLLENSVFYTAVNRVLNKYSAIEESLVFDEKEDVREATARLRQAAMMRRAVLDITRELEDLVLEGKNAKYDN